MKEFIKRLFLDVDAEPSTKRIFGAIAFVIASVAGFVLDNNEVMYAFLSFAAVSFGMTAFERKS